jgi:hypothetical protein
LIMFVSMKMVASMVTIMQQVFHLKILQIIWKNLLAIPNPCLTASHKLHPFAFSPFGHILCKNNLPYFVHGKLPMVGVDDKKLTNSNEET